MDPAALPLRDIHLPAPIGWWPLASGWWWLLASVMVLVVALALWRAPAGALRRRVDSWLFGADGLARGVFGVRRAALRELQAIAQALATDGNVHDCARALSALLRRIALRVHGPSAANPDERAWLAMLSSMSAAPLPTDLLDALRHAAYSPRVADTAQAQRYRDLTSALRPWMQRLRVPYRMPQGRAHAAL